MTFSHVRARWRHKAARRPLRSANLRKRSQPLKLPSRPGLALGHLYRRGRQLLGRGSPPKNEIDHHDVSPIGRCAVAERALSITRQLWRLGPISISPSQGAVQSLFGRRAHQRDCGPMANKLGQLRVVPKPQREHIAGATEDDGFPPPVVEGFLSEDEMPRRDVVPGPG